MFSSCVVARPALMCCTCVSLSSIFLVHLCMCSLQLFLTVMTKRKTLYVRESCNLFFTFILFPFLERVNISNISILFSLSGCWVLIVFRKMWKVHTWHHLINLLCSKMRQQGVNYSPFSWCSQSPCVSLIWLSLISNSNSVRLTPSCSWQCDTVNSPCFNFQWFFFTHWDGIFKSPITYTKEPRTELVELYLWAAQI